MIQKRNVLFMLILFATACCLCGCTNPDTAQANTPTTAPAISEPATPTPIQVPENTTVPTATSVPVETGTPAPTATSTPTPSPTATPTPTPSPTPIPTVAPAPAAVNTDTTTYDFIINRDYPLTAAYKPNDLVAPDIPFSFSSKTEDKRKLRKIAADALEELCDAALSEDGLTIYGVSGYRSFDRQYDIYGSNLINRGIRHTNLYSAAPGNSEHQTGLAIDVSCKSIGYRLIESFANTAEGIWLKENCWRFGFILRYPKDKESITGYAYEPWHIRYVGVPLAYYLHTNDLTLEEYYGSPSSHTLEELEDTPLIDMTTERFYKLYAFTLDSELYYLKDGSIWISEATGFPYLKEKILDAAGNALQVNGTPLYLEPALDAEGNYALDAEGNICYTRPYFDAEGNLWLDYNGSPVYLQPLWNADGTLAYDAEGNLLYTEPVTDINGMVIITETGSLIQKVPLRNGMGELTYYLDGSIAFYEPFVNPITGEYILDSSTGLPLYPSGYYKVPHNTLPLPGEGTSAEDTVPDSDEDTSAEDTVPDSGEDTSAEDTVPDSGEDTSAEDTVPDSDEDTSAEDTVPDSDEEPIPEPETPSYDTTYETGGFFG